jgi:hypothetical protein
MLFAITAIIDLGLLLLARVPHLYNYAVEITEANAPRQFLLARRLILSMANVTTAVFLYVYLATWRVAAGAADGLSPLFVFVVIAALVVVLAAYLTSSFRAR